jgi:uncharacterized membrane protein
MSYASNFPKPLKPARPRGPVRAAVLRGLTGFIPPLLTVVILLWLFGTLHYYVLEPVTQGTKAVLARYMASQQLVRDDSRSGYVKTSDEQPTYAPAKVYKTVAEFDGPSTTSMYTGRKLYERYVDIEFKWYYVVPWLLGIFIVVLYFLGKLLAGRLGQFIWDQIERMIHRLPLVRNVYSAIKQVTDFVLNHKEFQFSRVVAVEYPRKNTWSIGFVTSESFADIHRVVNEPIIAVLIPASPWSLTGYTTTVLKSETIELDITVDQALEFIVSCGVVIPPHQTWMLRGRDGPPQRAAQSPASLEDKRNREMTKDQ